MRLIDCFIPLLAYVSYLVRSDQGAHPADYEKARKDIGELIRQSEACVSDGAVNRSDYDMARFAIFAWIDEAVMSSSWEGRRQWQRELLQREYYHTTDAGEVFFDRLNQIGLHQRDVREVYYICLALGFTGQYGNAGDAVLLAGLRDENLKILTGRSVGTPSLNDQELFPQAYAAASGEPAEVAPGKRFSAVTGICLVAPVVLYAVLFVVYHFVLGNVGDSLIQAVS